ncbi:MAG TPA: NADH-quinone oxidoreductase subunit N [Acidobacteriaceae bacterium]|nr:NADH-quinone oxidoreductase subunit N [Acidobacteriaceae bacterium]
MSGYVDLLRLTAPEIVVTLAGLLLLILDLSLLRRASLAARFRSAVLIGCAGCIVAVLWLERMAAQGALPAGMLVVNSLTQLLQLALLALAIMVLLLALSARFTTHAGEYCSLILFATVAMMLLVSTQNLLVIFITIEFLSLSLYVLTAFDKESSQSAEAGLKYFLYGGMSAGILLFGMSLLYGISGSLALEPIAAAVSSLPSDPLLTLGIVMVMTGFGFKIAAAPFHMWAPEVYQGAPTSSASLVASSSKVASFFALFVVFSIGLAGAAGSAELGNHSAGWTGLMAVVAAASMLWGNLAAIAQTSVRRLLAFSAVGHAGYMLIALVAHSRQSLIALVYYVVTYALATAGAFAVLGALEDEKIDSIVDFKGLAKRAPDLSFCLLIFLLSLAGIPPLSGFFGKFYVFTAALNQGNHLGLLWLVLLALATSMVSFYYYLKVLKQAYVAEPTAGATAIHAPASKRAICWIVAALVVLLGCLPDLLLNKIAAAVPNAFR